MTGHDQIDDRREQWPLLRLVACRMPVMHHYMYVVHVDQASKRGLPEVFHVSSRRSSHTCAIMPVIYRKCFDCKQTASHGLAPAAAVACYTSLPTPSKSKRSAFHSCWVSRARSRRGPGGPRRFNSVCLSVCLSGIKLLFHPRIGTKFVSVDR